jgi:hypothetical protein
VKPAKLDCRSETGSITVQFPPLEVATKLPEREYRTNIRTGVGSIHGQFIHGKTTELSTNSGSISGDILPYYADDYVSTLKSESHSGMTYLTVLSPYTGQKIERMASSHETMTGSLNLLYPQEWEGNISGSTMTGSLTLRGKDVDVKEFDDGWVSKKIRAVKGKGDLKGQLTFNTKTGSSYVTIGETLEQSLGRSCKTLADDIGDLW